MTYNSDMTLVSKCGGCSKKDFFTSRDPGCECEISENKIYKIADTFFSKSPKNYKSLRELLIVLNSCEGCRDDFIVKRDLDIERHVHPAIKYLAQITKGSYLDIGCGSFLPAMSNAALLGTSPFGIDWADRRICKPMYESFALMSEEGDPLSGAECPTDLKFVTACDILHHVKNPEILITKVLERVLSQGYVLIMDHDCCSWEDAYYLDWAHLIFSKAVGDVDPGYLPVYGYRGRSYWRALMKSKGCLLVYEKVCPEGYKSYVDVYKKT